MANKDAFENGIPLGKDTEYQFDYDATLLFPIARQQGRDQIPLAADSLPFTGFDRWTAFELSWLNEHGVPQVAIAEFDFPHSSQFIIESKSFKLYLNSFNQTVIADKFTLIDILQRDLSAACNGHVVARLMAVDDYPVAEPDGFQCLDELPITCKHYQPNASLLTIDNASGKWQLKSHLLRSLCPVTGQPDWASVYIEYSGKRINPESLLAYIISYRNHQGFHEQCVEQIFCDIHKHCSPEQLTVYARFMRRGGLDINPIRSTTDDISEIDRFSRFRTARQ